MTTSEMREMKIYEKQSGERAIACLTCLSEGSMSYWYPNQVNEQHCHVITDNSIMLKTVARKLQYQMKECYGNVKKTSL